MAKIILIGLAAGAATALLFASVASGSPVSVLLFYLAPLPILIAALGWSHWAGLVAAVAASIGLAAVFGSLFFITFLLAIGLPAWWLGYLALLARPAERETPDGLEWYPVGQLVVWAALLGAAVVVGAMVNFGTGEGGFQSTLREGLERMLNATARTPADPTERARILDFLILVLPPAAAIVTTLTNLMNLWLAARITRVSGRLTRPWPDLFSMRFPNWAPLVIAVALAGSMLGGVAGLAAGILAAAMLTAYAILGFAILHALTLHVRNRALILGGVYIATLVFGWPILGMALMGLADAALDLRNRFPRRGPPPAAVP